MSAPRIPAGGPAGLLLGVLCLAAGACAGPERAASGRLRGGGRPALPAASEPAPAEPAGPLEVTVREAILLALENNRSLRIERLAPERSRAAEESAAAAFDPVLTGGASASRDEDEDDGTSDRTGVDVGASKLFPTGTEVEVGLSTDRSWSDLYGDQHTARAGLTVTQALLRGGGLGRNLASLRQARLETRASEYELRGFAESLVAGVEETYWDCALAGRRIEIVSDSLKLAEQQLAETGERIKVGKLPEIELAAAKAEVARRREGLIDARSVLATTRLRMVRLLSPPGASPWTRELVLRDAPAVPEAVLDDVESHVRVALRQRPDLNQALLALEREELELVRTRNGLLPRLDLFITLGGTGYADSFGDAVEDLDGENYDVSAGISLEYALGNRAARASHQRALLGRRQAEEALANLEQLVQVDVRSAHIEVGRAREQVAATDATRKLQEEALRAETEKFKVGKSTAFLVAQAQRDLLASRLAQAEAVASYLKAMTELYRLSGTLLERRSLDVPGRVHLGRLAPAPEPDAAPPAGETPAAPPE